MRCSKGFHPPSSCAVESLWKLENWWKLQVWNQGFWCPTQNLALWALGFARQELRFAVPNLQVSFRTYCAGHWGHWEHCMECQKINTSQSSNWHYYTGWWFSWNINFIFPETVGNVIIPIDFPPIFQRGRLVVHEILGMIDALRICSRWLSKWIQMEPYWSPP